MSDDSLLQECLLYLCRRVNRNYHIVCDGERFVGIPALPMLDHFIRRRDSPQQLPLTWLETLGLDRSLQQTSVGLCEYIAGLVAPSMPKPTRVGAEWIEQEHIEQVLKGWDDIETECLLWLMQQDTLHYLYRRRMELDDGEGNPKGNPKSGNEGRQVTKQPVVECWPAIATLECYLQTGHDVSIASEWKDRIGERSLPGERPYMSRDVIASAVQFCGGLDADKPWVKV